MILFLTSSPCSNDVPAGVSLPCVLDRSNGFVRRLRRVFPQGGNLLVIADDPDNVMRQGMPVTVTLRKDGGKP